MGFLSHVDLGTSFITLFGFYLLFGAYFIFALCWCVSLAFTPLYNFFRRTKFDIGPYFMFLAGNLILDDIAAENTEKFPDIKMQSCLKRSKCKQ